MRKLMRMLLALVLVLAIAAPMIPALAEEVETTARCRCT